jgi:hypothetical protein
VATHQRPVLLRSVSYDQITGIPSVRTTGGEGPSSTTIVWELKSGELELAFRPRQAKAILATVTEHTGLAAPGRGRGLARSSARRG